MSLEKRPSHYLSTIDLAVAPIRIGYQMLAARRCEVQKFTVRHCRYCKQFPDVVILAHPSAPDVVRRPTTSSTNAMIKYVERRKQPICC